MFVIFVQLHVTPLTEGSASIQGVLRSGSRGKQEAVCAPAKGSEVRLLGGSLPAACVRDSEFNSSEDGEHGTHTEMTCSPALVTKAVCVFIPNRCSG